MGSIWCAFDFVVCCYFLANPSMQINAAKGCFWFNRTLLLQWIDYLFLLFCIIEMQKKRKYNAGDRMRITMKSFSWLIFGLMKCIRSIHTHWLDWNCCNGRDLVCVSHQMPRHLGPLFMEDNSEIVLLQFACNALIKQMHSSTESEIQWS